MRIRRFLHIILAVTALCLVWQIAVTWSRGLGAYAERAERLQEEAGSLISLPVRSSRAGQRFAQRITDKDLFSPERKRPVVVAQAAAAEPVPPPSHLKLVGVFLTPGREEAFLADSSQGNNVTRVQKGEQIDRYRLTRLTASQATLSLGDDGGEVALPLTLLDSQSAKKLPRLTPKKTSAKAKAKPARQAGQDQQKDEDPAQIRQNIRQLQKRLRQIRRQAVRERKDTARRATEEEPAAEPQAAEPQAERAER